MDQNLLEFFVPPDDVIYKDFNFKIFVLGKLISGWRKDVDIANHKFVTNNFHNYLFSRCKVTLNGVTITQVKKRYNYRSYVEISRTTAKMQ